jgi:hypothetical protein
VAKSKTSAIKAQPQLQPQVQPQVHSALLDRVVQDSATPDHVTTPPAGTVLLAQVAEIDANGRAWLQVQGMGRMQAAHSLVPIQAEHIGQQVALSMTSSGPLVLGLLWTARAQAKTNEVHADGQRHVIHAEEEIELRCGEAAIVLTADGHIQLRGTYITSQASATQRILGGSVNVN